MKNGQAYLFVVEFLRVLFLFAFLSFENVEICGLSKSIQLIGYTQLLQWIGRQIKHLF
jgi:hypothetical protein